MLLIANNVIISLKSNNLAKMMTYVFIVAGLR